MEHHLGPSDVLLVQTIRDSDGDDAPAPATVSGATIVPSRNALEEPGDVARFGQLRVQVLSRLLPAPLALAVLGVWALSAIGGAWILQRRRAR
ncbi:hypothetical protein [Rathayibacter rathayi]|uniref:Uncharacterized protein n=1 Tax=Rathayibacter rathayi TaxID=33887 RepID=A0ABD6WC21_RATRA|nr:hypothetical protein [Rathayibacter rathayi]AZZ48328.1 hypothetical protein C1O28_03180 [Rathayibacter rathayi]MWV74225.1 hypothetical protein [Rathayibacter rathayi NCPPB 2980 = VKM Ac-1601]PPF16023.1 hypothetical protein C5C04_02130 [Rathayibacter rathayi]PPF22799.1 hypothetical protein C5C34_11255 [Rathayibacter rathayi]PPF45801.1 hypothetical protein C5C08_12070 [Rathayibacter rathayi]